MFCGCLNSNNEQQNELIIRGPFASQLDHVVNRQNKNQMIEAMTHLITYNFVIPSDYEREYKKCKLNSSQFVDKSFLPNATSLNYTVHGRRILWKRITQIIPNAQIVERQIEPSDIQQGNIGDCYFLACLAAIAENPERIRRIFCDEMSIKSEGIYRLQLACQGKYTEIVIDDYVPVFEGSNRPVFCKPSGNQVWVMLLEKAWAKLSGSYGNISAGYPHEILNTFSVAPCFYFDIPNLLVKQEQQKKELWIKILEATKLKLPMCAGSRQNHTCKGIKSAHTYTVLGAYQINTSSRGGVQLLKLRNPWGDTEYVGKFSELDTSFWQSVDPMTKLVIFGNGHSNDGIFTIEFNEFIRNFECIDISHDLPNYNYTFETVNAQNYEPNYFQLDVIEDGKQNDNFYITMEKDFNRNQFIRNRQTQYGYSRLIIARIQSSQSQISYEYISSLLQTNFPDATIKCKSLKSGKYIIMAQTEHPNKSEGEITLSVYSKAKMNIRKVVNKRQNFLQKVFSSHANSHQFVQKRFLINSNSNSWTLSMFLFKEGGYGYICTNIAYSSKEKVKVTCNLQKVFAEGFYLIDGDRKINQGIFEITIEPGRCELFLLGIDLKRDFRELSFPPKGIKMQRII